MVRSGSWSFAEVELKCLDPKPFDGELRIQQRDRDGDVTVAVQEVALAPGEDWRSYEVYFNPNVSSSGDRIAVRLFDADGVLVRFLSDAKVEMEELISDPFMDLGSEELLILDLTIPRRLPHVAWLDTRRQPRATGTINVRTVRLLSPKDLPSKWIGLECVDAIVWDDVDPSVLQQQQTTALLDWVRCGGRLLITKSSEWQLLMNSPLAEVLPVQITDVQGDHEVQAFTRDIVQSDNYGNSLARSYAKLEHGVPVARLQRMGSSPDVVSIPAKSTGVDPIAYRRFIGRGCLTFVGASFRDLMPPPEELRILDDDTVNYVSKEDDTPDFIRYSENIIARNLLALPQVREPGTNFLQFSTDLFDNVRSTIWFQALGAAFLIFAILFAVTYCVSATWGSWWYLRRRGWAHLCWSAFAIVSLAGVVLGTGMVWTLRGVTTKLWQTTVVDGRAGDDYAHATCLFGVKTPDHTRLDLRLPIGERVGSAPQEFGPIHVMPPSSSIEREESSFVAPEQYVSTRAGTFLNGVPVRATLKEFMGRWHGPLDGRLEARLVVDEDDMFCQGSFIENKLGFPLIECYILEERAEIATNRGITQCLYLGELPPADPGEQFDVGAFRQKLYFKPKRQTADEPERVDNRTLSLAACIGQWRRELPGGAMMGSSDDRDSRRRAERRDLASMLMLSVFNLIDDWEGSKQDMRRSFGRSLDVSHLITKETAVLIGFSDARPPAVLEIDGRNLYPEQALTMYRFVIPVERR